MENFSSFLSVYELSNRKKIMAKDLKSIIFMVKLIFIHQEPRDGRIAGLCLEKVTPASASRHTDTLHPASTYLCAGECAKQRSLHLNGEAKIVFQVKNVQPTSAHYTPRLSSPCGVSDDRDVSIELVPSAV